MVVRLCLSREGRDVGSIEVKLKGVYFSFVRLILATCAILSFLGLGLIVVLRYIFFCSSQLSSFEGGSSVVFLPAT